MVISRLELNSEGTVRKFVQWHNNPRVFCTSCFHMHNQLSTHLSVCLAALMLMFPLWNFNYLISAQLSLTLASAYMSYLSPLFPTFPKLFVSLLIMIVDLQGWGVVGFFNWNKLFLSSFICHPSRFALIQIHWSRKWTVRSQRLQISCGKKPNNRQR